MAKGNYQVIFSGEILEHADIDMVKSNVARVFSLPSDRIEKLFSGQRLVLKKDIDQVTAERYKTTLQRAGALCEIEDTAASPQIPSAEKVKPAVTQASTPQVEETGMTVADPGSQIGERTEVADANIDTGDMDMAEVGITLVESEPVPNANIDTGDIDMAEVGITLVESDPVPDANIDTSGIDMAEVGITLAEPEEFLEAEFDLSELSMDEAGATLVESKSVPDANIDTSQLSLD